MKNYEKTIIRFNRFGRLVFRNAKNENPFNPINPMIKQNS